MSSLPETVLVCPRCEHRGMATPGSMCPNDGALLIPGIRLTDAASDPLLGSVVAAKYGIFDVLGRGAFGAVYRAFQQPMGRSVALKVMLAKHENVPELRRRFAIEAAALGDLSHPSVVRLYDFGEDQGMLYLVFEYVDGLSLSRAIATPGLMSPGTAAAITLQVLGVLTEAHEQGLVHRDIKPPNILCRTGPWGEIQVKLIDFGLARQLLEDGASSPMATRAGVFLGTPRYAAPEQCMGSPATASSDIYSLGLVLYEMLTHHPLNREANPRDILRAHMKAEWGPALDALHLTAELEGLRDVLRRATARMPEDRFASAHEMALAVHAAVPRAVLKSQSPTHESTLGSIPPSEANNDLLTTRTETPRWTPEGGAEEPFQDSTLRTQDPAAGDALEPGELPSFQSGSTSGRPRPPVPPRLTGRAAVTTAARAPEAEERGSSTWLILVTMAAAAAGLGVYFATRG